MSTWEGPSHYLGVCYYEEDERPQSSPWGKSTQAYSRTEQLAPVNPQISTGESKSLMLSMTDLQNGCVGGRMAVSVCPIQRDCFLFPE